MKCTRADDNCFRCGAERECLILAAPPFRQPCSFYKPYRFDYDTAFIKQERRGVWKCVRGWDGLYMVNNYGDVWSAISGKNIKHEYREGEVYVMLCWHDQKCRTKLVNLVADAFVHGEGKIYFKDGNSLNVSAENIGRTTW